MNLETFIERKKQIEDKAENELKELRKEFAFSNNRYKIGDIVADRIGKIKIEMILVRKLIWSNCGTSECLYYGLELRKDGKPKKNDNKRRVYQSNIID